MRLNSRDLVNDPKNGAEVYPITATNAVYREGGENLEEILTRLGNNIDKKVIDDITYIANTNTLVKSYTDNTTENISLPNWVKNVAVTKNNRTYTITVTPTTGSASTYTIELPNVTTSGTGNGLSDISYNSSTNTITATKTTFLTEHQQIPVTDVKVNNTSVVTNKVANITLPTVGNLNTNNSQAQALSSSESFSNNINLHKISKTGNYNDLLNLPQGFGDYPTVTSAWDSNNQINIITFHPEVSSEINSIVLKPDNNNYIKCKIIAPSPDENWQSYKWFCGKVIIKISTTDISTNSKTYLLLDKQSTDFNVRSTGITSSVWTHQTFMPSIDINNITYYRFLINPTLLYVTHNGIVSAQNYAFFIAECKVFQPSPYSSTSTYAPNCHCSFSIKPEFPNPVLNNNDIHAVQYVDNERTYQSMTKDPNTLYFIPVENS